MSKKPTLTKCLNKFNNSLKSIRQLLIESEPDKEAEIDKQLSSWLNSPGNPLKQVQKRYFNH